ncbi:MAG: M14 family metallopeptidase [Bacteroidota bacterium]
MTTASALRLHLGAVIAIVFFVGCAGPEAGTRAAPPSGPLTRAEATDYRETSTHADVLAFLGQVEGEQIHLGVFGQSGEGRDLPFAVWGAPSADPEAVRQTGKTRVLVFANIHAGEVAGKEAALMLLRDLANGMHARWADSLVVMVAPNYNADGNERVALDNRRLQFGPVGGMGQRPNAAGLDLNRDFMKLASPEARALVGLLGDADPHVVVDLHTTNGTHMGYHLTYAPGLSPSTPAPIDRALRDDWLPAISEAILASDDLATWHYGNVPGAFGEAATAPRGWYSFSAQPRFGTNYVGLRGRYAILSEAYSYAPFDERVVVTKRFVEEILNQAWARASEVRRHTADADAASVVGEEIAVRATWDPLPEPQPVLLGAVDTVAHPTTGDPMLARRDVRTPETMPAYVRFAASETVTAPEAYVLRLGAGLDRVSDLLDAHGIAYEVDRSSRTLAESSVERFRVDSVRVAPRPFQGIRMQQAWGEWEAVPPSVMVDIEGTEMRSAPGPALVIPVDQPLGRLVVALFEPRSDDGLVAWAILGPEALPEGGFAAIERIPAR